MTRAACTNRYSDRDRSVQWRIGDGCSNSRDKIPDMSDSDGLPIASDSGFQATLREQQSRWREAQGLPIGEHNGRPLGSRLAMPFAQYELVNYLTPTIRDLVRREVIDRPGDQDKLYGKPRIFNDLLSSQPLCFNLFGELSADLDLATRTCQSLWPGVVGEVTAIEFEWSPGRGDPRFLENRSAFDIAVFHTTPKGGRGFIGIEMKYHENLRVSAATPRSRYDEVAAASNVFLEHRADALRRPPLQQIWLDHLLALSMLQADDSFDVGRFVFVYPAINNRCEKISTEYEQHIDKPDSFQRLTIETIVEEIRRAGADAWIDEFEDRYL